MPEETQFGKEQQFEAFFNLHPDALSITRVSDGEIVEVNKGYLELIGCDKDEVLGKTSREFDVWDNPKDRRKLFDIILTNKIVKNFESTFRKKSGERFYALVTASLIELENKPHIISITRDITTEKLAGVNLTYSERLLKETQQIAGLGSYVIEFKTNSWTSSEVLDDIFGIDASFERTIENWLKIVHPDWREMMWNYFQNEVVHQKKQFDKEYKITSLSDGKEKWVSGKGELEFDENGALLRMVGTIMDITYQKTIELELANEQKLLDNILETSPVGIVVVEKDGAISYANEAGVKILGLTKSDIKQLTYNAPDWKITDWEGKPFPDEQLPFMVVKNTLKACLNIQHAIEYANGKRVMLSVNAAPLFDDNKTFNGMVASIEDITDRKITEVKIHQQNEELFELNATKDKLFSVIGHDLRSPIASVMRMTQLLKEEYKELAPGKIEEFLNIIIEGIENGYKLLENLLEWSRFQTGAIKFSPQNFELKPLIDGNLKLLKPIAKNKKIELLTNPDVNIRVLGDENMINTVLRNLLSNAIKFTPSGGEISVKVVQNNEDVIISVVDTGVGIKKEDIRKLFQLGENFSTYGTENEKGTGLGLCLCNDFIKKHNAQIIVESEPGKGSKFSFKLPKSS